MSESVLCEDDIIFSSPMLGYYPSSSFTAKLQQHIVRKTLVRFVWLVVVQYRSAASWMDGEFQCLFAHFRRVALCVDAAASATGLHDILD